MKGLKIGFIIFIGGIKKNEDNVGLLFLLDKKKTNPTACGIDQPRPAQWDNIDDVCTGSIGC